MRPGCPMLSILPMKRAHCCPLSSNQSPGNPQQPETCLKESCELWVPPGLLHVDSQFFKGSQT